MTEHIAPGRRANPSFQPHDTGGLVVLDEDGNLLEKMMTWNDAHLMKTVSDHRRGTEALGIITRDGQRRIRDAYDEVLDPTPNKDWDW